MDGFRAYLDHLATTPLDPAVLEAMMPVLAGPPGNPHARAHAYGRAASDAVEAARAEVAAAVGAKPAQVTLVPSATAADNLAVIGVATGRERRGRHVLVTATEHPAVLGPADALAARGFDVERIPVDGAGVVDPDEVALRLRPDTVLVSVMAVNNETGAVNPVEAVAAATRARGVALHVDAAQAPGRVDLAMLARADLVTLSSHKVHGPQGAAALVHRVPGGFRPRPVLWGGGQEGGLWPGTVNVAAAVGFGRAMTLAVRGREAEVARVAILSARLLEGLVDAAPGSRRNGDPARCVPHCLSVTFAGVAGETLLGALGRAGVAASFGSACATGSNEPSHVLAAMGLSPAEARRTLRFGLGRFTTADEVDYAIGVVREVATRAR